MKKKLKILIQIQEFGERIQRQFQNSSSAPRNITCPRIYACLLLSLTLLFWLNYPGGEIALGQTVSIPSPIGTWRWTESLRARPGRTIRLIGGRHQQWLREHLSCSQGRGGQYTGRWKTNHISINKEKMLGDMSRHRPAAGKIKKKSKTWGAPSFSL